MQEKNPEEKKAARKELLEKVKHNLLPTTWEKRFRSKRFWGLASIILLVTTFFVWFFWGMPAPWKIASLKNVSVSTKILDRKGNLIYEIYSDQKRTPIALSDIPKHAIEATISIEDKDFYKHYGFSLRGYLRAIYKIVFRQKIEGGSTLTQQLVKNSLLTSQRTVRRKAQELILSVIVETIYSKDQILEMYFNQIPYGGTAYGIEAASELYFGKSAKDLSLAESALLAGLPAAPSKYSPFGSRPELAKQRQKEVLKQMVTDNYITEEHMESILRETLNFVKPQSGIKAPHFALFIKEQLADKYGENIVERGGLRVTTTLDLDLQGKAQEIVANEIEKLSSQNVGNGALVVTRPESGEILAMVGSKDYFAQDEDGKVNIVFAQRQPGSSIKPLNYALALKDGKITPSTPLADVPTCFAVFGQTLYCPQNYDGGFHGAVQARFALGNSYNIPAVRVLALNGLTNFVDFAKQMGLTTLEDPSKYGLSLTLGGGEVRPIDMAEAFGVFANQGIKQPLISILKVEDYKGKVLEETDLANISDQGQRLLDPSVTFLVSHILLDNNARVAAFGDRSYLNVPGHPEVSVKTGTTNDRRDNWTIGYTKHAVAVVWVGNNDNSPMGGAVSGISGASPIWNRTMKEVLDKAEEGYYNSEDEGHAWPLQPSGVSGANVCWDSGRPPGGDESGCQTRFEYFLSDNLPKPMDQIRHDIPIDKTTGEIARPDTPPENQETQNRSTLWDPLGTMICLDCPIPKSSVTLKYPL